MNGGLQFGKNQIHFLSVFRGGDPCAQLPDAVIETTRAHGHEKTSIVHDGGLILLSLFSGLCDTLHTVETGLLNLLYSCAQGWVVMRSSTAPSERFGRCQPPVTRSASQASIWPPKHFQEGMCPRGRC